jgi:hypothetical protein
MFYSLLLTMAADAMFVDLGVQQLASSILFEGVVQSSAVRTL